MKLNSDNLNINLRHLRALHAVAQEGSFSAAAARLGIVPSALSELIRHLEENVGAVLFDRTTRPAAMTPLARDFLKETMPLLDGMDQAVTHLRQRAGLKVGSLAIGASPSAISELLAPLLTEFMADKPGIRLTLHDDIAERLARMVSDGQLDLALAGRALQSHDLHQRAIMRDAFGLACRRDHPLAGKPGIMLDDLAAETLIGLAAETGTHQILLRSDLPRALLHARITAHSTIAQLCMVRAGMGVALLPENAVNLFRDPQIAFLRLADFHLWRTLYLLEPARRPPTPLANGFVAALEARMTGLTEGNLVAD